ncbi:acyl-CoA N-acyltransferase [Poronia punctata]|nr:acyl-CoA N-acyltransferase [Poronia punctata]
MTSTAEETPLVEVISDPADFADAYRCCSEAFGRQVNDATWIGFNPTWDTPEGQAGGAERMAKRWQSTTTDDKGNPHTIFLKSTVPDPGRPGQRVIAGFAIWIQATAIPGGQHGDLISDNPDEMRKLLNLESIYPGNETEQRFILQLFNSLLKRRHEFVRENPPSVMVLDLCATHPAFQRRGVASRLVQWGLDEMRRRGIKYATTEGSAMGRHVYKRLGFEPEGIDIMYEVDDEFADRELPPNLFMIHSST